MLDAQGIAQPESVIQAIKFTYSWLPAVLSLIVLVLLIVFFDIEKKLPKMLEEAGEGNN